MRGAIGGFLLTHLRLAQWKAACKDLAGSNHRTQLPPHINGILRAFPDLRVTLKDQIADGDKVVTRKTFRGTHRGEFPRIAPSGKSLELELIDIFCVTNGRLAEHRAQFDVMAVLRQIGAQAS